MKAVYLQYNAVRSDAADPLPAFCKKVFDYIDQNAVENLILDVRWNGGGNSFLNRNIQDGILARPKINQKGHFFLPTVLTGVNHEMLVMREETFGPVVGVMPYRTVDEAIQLANATPYGLATYVYTDDLGEADEFSSRLESGNVAINNPDAGVINAPYGGFKDSGQGYEHGPEGLEQYLQAKHIRIRYFNRKL
jgi:acyl-CoA reductase-like NAD-dependent aldehyde dehydrogenase